MEAKRETAVWASMVASFQNAGGRNIAKIEAWVGDYKSYTRQGNDVKCRTFNAKYMDCLDADVSGDAPAPNIRRC